MRRNSRELGAKKPVQAFIYIPHRFLRIFQDYAYSGKYEISYLPLRIKSDPLQLAVKTSYSVLPLREQKLLPSIIR